ncbi:hypothetical protein OPT61_g6270 [Boeremia exigua]|uniref:Uncharacterized protein n=1 Tax=Boeremia exigua TaxID=749465 RepID=A0ACC2I7A8_9PLEO|nr:hypothetical protein OPT61_g6270 [Boeremia exigua]
MSGVGATNSLKPYSWPLTDILVSGESQTTSLNSPHSCHVGRPSQGASAVQNNLPGAAINFHVPFRNDSSYQQVLNPASRSGTLHGSGYERAVMSVDLSRRHMQSEEATTNEVNPSLSTVQLRGGAAHRQNGRFNWLRKARSVDRGLDKDRAGSTSPPVTYRGKRIGSPHLISPLHVLPPASRFVKKPKETSPSIAVESPPKKSFTINSDQSPRISRRDYSANTKVLPLPPPAALLATPSRPATSNPFAGIYGNPYLLRAGPSSPPVDYSAAKSLITRPSALDGSQTGYGQVAVPQNRRPLHEHNEVAEHVNKPQVPDVKLTTHKAGVDRKWDPLPALPNERAVPEPISKETQTREEAADDEPLDTDEVLNSLRPERLGLYHVSRVERPIDAPVSADHDSTVGNTQPAQAATLAPEVAHGNDDHSIRTRDWDLQSCDTDDLGVDIQLEKQRELAKRAQKRRLPRGQQRQENVRDNNDSLNGLPEEDAPTPESIFYSNLIDIVRDYQEQLESVIQRAYEAGEMSEDHWLREKWRHKTGLDRKLQTAEQISGYRILTAENDIKEAIKQPAGYAIYSSLLRLRDPETWHRIFEPVSVQPPLTPGTTISSHPNAKENSLRWLARKTGRALRFMLAVPDDPELKTHSSRHPPTNIVTYQPPVGVLGPNISVRPQHVDRSGSSNPTVPFPRNPAPIRSEPRPSTHTERPSKVSNETIRVNDNTMFTGTTLASPLNGRFVRAPRSRGYEQSGFVTVLNPTSHSATGEKMTKRRSTGKPKRSRVRDGESTVTAWPEAAC